MMCLSSSWTISWGVIRAFRWCAADWCRCKDRRRSSSARFTISSGGEVGVVEQRARRGLRVRTAAADRDQPVLGLEHVAVAGDDERGFAVGDGEHRFEPAQDAVGAPVLRELDRRAREIALVLLELRLEALEQRERVRRAAGETGEDAVLVEAPHLARARLDDDVAERDLAVAAERDAACRAAPKGWSCRGMWA